MHRVQSDLTLRNNYQRRRFQRQLYQPSDPVPRTNQVETNRAPLPLFRQSVGRVRRSAKGDSAYSGRYAHAARPRCCRAMRLAHPDVFAVLTTAMSSNAHLMYYRNGGERRVDTSNVIFVLISDIGVAKMEQLLIQYKHRRDVPVTKLENDVRRALDAQWARLQFGKMVRQVVPFLPFEPHHIVQVIQAKLDQLSRHYEGVYWKSLAFDSGLAAHLSTLESMLYMERRAIVHDVEVRKVFAKYGARNVESGPMQQLKAKLMRHARPWNPEAQFTVRLLADSRTIDIVSCVEERTTGQLPDTTTMGDGSAADVITLACVSRWQGVFT
ncbi:hypothetical protein, variant 4 [Aphanomyces invadans]|uniref:Uncharacterized protein n=1 Tax=Aphanomyces invadans TaxID=157072 RepID=A0A024UK34_9STRA|nr:hypothetical protein, variant 4 [Aphanomyces invadans]ETW06227.1 hypothetical protein, variant 4 [Aphanomyces invadans]|eukprot:XP_008864302.1 hypothetical protein, variant 4 [Aphanomyces invadans]